MYKKVIASSLILLFALAICFTSSCTRQENDTDAEKKAAIRRTIIAYITSDNNLNQNLNTDINEMKLGSKKLPSDCRMILFVDQLYNTPYIAELENGEMKTIKQYNEDFYSTSADSMKNVLQWIIDQYPTNEYALIFTGHGTGSIAAEDTVQTNFTKLYAYGYDAHGEDSKTSTNKWLNIPSLAMVLNNLNNQHEEKIKFEYIFFDCCCMQTVETAYELKESTHYIIAPASETPASGAPYEAVVPILGTDKDEVGKAIIDEYINSTSWGNTGGIAISCVKTSEMDNLLDATIAALNSVKERKIANYEWSEDGIWDGVQWVKDKLELDKTRCIYYYKGEETGNAPVLHDIKNIMLLNLSSSEYYKWLTQFEKTVIASYCPSGNAKEPWLSAVGINFYSFDVTEDKCGAMGMIVPNAAYDDLHGFFSTISLNQTMFDLVWSNKVGWHSMGW